MPGQSVRLVFQRESPRPLRRHNGSRDREEQQPVSVTQRVSDPVPDADRVSDRNAHRETYAYRKTNTYGKADTYGRTDRSADTAAGRSYSGARNAPARRSSCRGPAGSVTGRFDSI